MIPRKILFETLKTGIDKAGWAIEEGIQTKYIDYIEQLHKWNLVHNLTAIHDPLEMVKRHVLDSLVLLPFLPAAASNDHLLDVGTGAGLPGIPLALSRPHWTFVLLDSNQKKINFVQHVILSLQLTNVVAVCARVETYQSETLFDLVVTRAFASLPEFVRLTRHLCKPEGRLVAMKGASLEPKDKTELPAGCTIEQIHQVMVPELAVLRSLVFVAMNTERVP
jgi:16S rRNA (guanine527-N7)-methyltransferase